MAHNMISLIVFAVCYAKHASAEVRDATQFGKTISKAFAPTGQMPQLSGSVPANPAAAVTPENADVVTGARFPMRETPSNNPFGLEFKGAYQHLRAPKQKMSQDSAKDAQYGLGFVSLLGVMALGGVVTSIGVATYRTYFTHGLGSSTARCADVSMSAASSAAEAKAALVARLLAAKEASGKTFDAIAAELGLTNAYTANLFYNQAQLKPGTEEKLRKAVPKIRETDLALMRKAPMRSFDPAILQEPNVYRTYEAITHNGEAIKALVNEKFGDGIMSAIDFYLDVGETTGKQGEKRVVITFNGKFLPHVEQVAAENTVPSPQG